MRVYQDRRSEGARWRTGWRLEIQPDGHGYQLTVTSPNGPVGGADTVRSLDPRHPATRNSVRWICERSGLPMSQALDALGDAYMQSQIQSEIRAATARRKTAVTS